MSLDIEWIKEQALSENYEFSAHADYERQNDKISILEIENVLLKAEIIEITHKIQGDTAV